LDALGEIALMIYNRGCAMHINPREEHDIRDNDASYCTYYSAILRSFETLFLWDAWKLGKNHEDPSLTSLELGKISCNGRRLNDWILDVPWRSWYLC